MRKSTVILLACVGVSLGRGPLPADGRSAARDRPARCRTRKHLRKAFGSTTGAAANAGYTDASGNYTIYLNQAAIRSFLYEYPSGVPRSRMVNARHPSPGRNHQGYAAGLPHGLTPSSGSTQ